MVNKKTVRNKETKTRESKIDRDLKRKMRVQRDIKTRFTERKGKRNIRE